MERVLSREKRPGGVQLTLWTCRSRVCGLLGRCVCHDRLEWPLARLVLVGEELAKSGTTLSLSHVVAFASKHLHEAGLITDSSLVRFCEFWRRFVVFSDRAGATCVGDVTPQLVTSFVNARQMNGLPPSIATRHLRRSAIRLLFKVLRQFRIADSDPTLDLVLPPRSGSVFRPLTDEEIDECRWASLNTLFATRQPAVWAVAETGATPSELAAVTLASLDLTGARVWLEASAKTRPRWAAFTEWGQLQVVRRVRDLGEGDGGRSLVYEGTRTGLARQASVAGALAHIMDRAGVGAEPDVRPTSVRAWLGRRAFQDGGRIEDVARQLGMLSLDGAASLIGFDWVGGGSSPDGCWRLPWDGTH